MKVLNLESTELHYETAVNLIGMIHRREISARELLQIHLDRIEQVNPKINAIVTHVPELAMEQARAADEKQARGEALGCLHGLPIAHKDLVSTAGIRTTFGSLLFKDFVPDRDELLVERLRSSGAITLGKTNVPEFGAGSQTYNEVFGETLNPWDFSKTCGGSSGGAAAALAAGMIPIADGSDMGGSLRNPANFCHVVGFRPSPGRVPMVPSEMAWEALSVMGPMARNVADLALLFSVMSGPDWRSPISIPESGDRFGGSLERDFSNVRIAWSQDFGCLPVDPAVTQVLESGRSTVESMGCHVDEAHADWAGADEAFKTLRAWTFAQTLGSLPEEKRKFLKETIRWNLEAGLALSGTDLSRAEVLRSRLYQRVGEFMQEYEFMMFPVSQVLPFDVSTRFPEEISGIKMENYIDWMKSSYFVSVIGLPSISLPFGFTSAGLPVGIQIVGRPQDDFGVLQLAASLEKSLGLSRVHPRIGL